MPDFTAAAADGVVTTQRPARRGFLDRDQILRAATRYIDDHGLARLTMRRLGAQLGVEAMALYRYVPSREDLLDGVVERLMDRLLDDPGLTVVRPNWQAYLQGVAHAVRRVALEHPQIFPIVATRPPEAPWLRPPLRSLRWVETFLSSLSECGLCDDDAVYVYRAFSTFLLGHLMLEVSALGADTGLIGGSGDRSRSAADLTQFPTLTRLAGRLAVDHGQQEFEESLESMLDRVQTSLTTS